MKRNLVFLSVIIVFIIAFSCEGGTSTFEVNCAECYVPEPDSFELLVEINNISEYDSVYLQFYKGNVESGELSWEGKVDVGTTEFLHRVPVNEYYSVKAIYAIDDETIIAIDGDRMTSKYITDACDYDCWIIKGGILDVRLKY